MNKQTPLFFTLATLMLTTNVYSATVTFNNGSGHYLAAGTSFIVGTQGGPLFYNPVENAIGVGHTVFDGAIALGEELSIQMSDTINIQKIYFRQWENPLLFWPLDSVNLSTNSNTITLTDSGQGVQLLDQFSVNLTDDYLKIKANNGLTAIYLHSIEFETPLHVPAPPAAWLFGSALIGLWRLRHGTQQPTVEVQ